MRYKNRKYLEWVKKQNCSCCSSPADDPHHIKGVGHLSGAGLTAPDWAVMPLCRRCHNLMHENSIMWDDQWEYISRTLGKAIQEGFFK